MNIQPDTLSGLELSNEAGLERHLVLALHTGSHPLNFGPCGQRTIVGMDLLVAVLLLGLVVYFLFRVLRGVLPARLWGRLRPPGMRLVPRKATEKCAVCKEALNPAEMAALRQGRRKCPEMARCPYQRRRWLN